ncbi:hypothetical protein [Curtobacterium sp. ISL-83]|uniref:hypothetical protein n=1 Tax=Curtobacterium sp. ISL-83 TaxID=2819145 RepID=UPI001BE6881F|nr:hypothetical protein [Curtobacterium sp. ISL-83]MBT2501675.1 hypothetical protein [Curtobacterium sp. ISL-83]
MNRYISDEAAVPARVVTYAHVRRMRTFGDTAVGTEPVLYEDFFTSSPVGGGRR